MTEKNQEYKTKIPPHSIEAEKAVLGSMLLDENCVLDGVDILSPDDFYNSAHKTIFKTILQLFGDETPIDVLTISDKLTEQELIEQVGGMLYISNLPDDVPTTANFDFYAEKIKALAKRRRVINVAKKAYHDGFNLKNDSYIEDTEQAIYEAAQTDQKQHFQSMPQILKATVADLKMLQKNKGAVTGVATGLEELDKLTCGLHPGQLIIIGARPSIGKTALALSIAEHIATSPSKDNPDVNQAVAFFSLEMTAVELVKRVLSSHARIDGQHLKNGEFTTVELTTLGSSLAYLKSANLHIDQTSSLTPIELRARVRRLVSKNPNLKTVIVDYIQLMDSNTFSENRQQAIAFISRSLKSLAMELNIFVIALSQLNRESEKGVGKGAVPPPPRLAQLKESGAIEQDADVVILLHRPGFYSTDPKYSGKCTLGIEKQRNGPVGSVEVRFEERFSRFGNL